MNQGHWVFRFYVSALVDVAEVDEYLGHFRLVWPRANRMLTVCASRRNHQRASLTSFSGTNVNVFARVKILIPAITLATRVSVIPETGMHR